MKRFAFLTRGPWRRLAYALGSGALAFVFIGAFTEGALAWSTWSLWVFSAFVAALGFYVYDKVD